MDEDQDEYNAGPHQPRQGRHPQRNRHNANAGPAPRQRGNFRQPLQNRPQPEHQGVQRRGNQNPGQNFRQNQENRNRHPYQRNDRQPQGNNAGGYRQKNQNNRQLNENVDHDRQNRTPRFMGFRMLDELAKSEAKDILVKINDKKQCFLELIESPIERLDVYVLIVELISKVCQSSFDELKSKLLLEICNSRFIGNLRNYLMDLPYTASKGNNNLYWNNQAGFWNNFILFCDCLINIAPSVALLKCRSLIDATSKCCLEELSNRHNFSLPVEKNAKLIQLRERLVACEKQEDENKEKKKGNKFDIESEPPDSFRLLSVVPRSEDLLELRPFVRPNIVDGGYRDVEHYLDVQFRLMREDCFGPLRDGIRQFIENPHNKKFDNIRVYRDVKFVEPYISKSKIGSVVQLDSKTMKRFKKVNWSHSKRFIFGSLLLFTKDNCKSFITATIIDRDIKLVSQGKIPIDIVDIITSDAIAYNDELYVMIESEVYFEPYYHVMKALQDPQFPENIAMSKYIVNVDPTPLPPTYVNPQTVYAVSTAFSMRTKFVVLDEETWPSKEELSLNQTQYDAYKLALTHEFAVIQGPPGTGKTFLGIKVARTLLENITPSNGACLMLVICYTNHALDQFLEDILPITDSIVRIGGQSRNEAMEKINLATLRRFRGRTDGNRLFLEQRHNLKRVILELQHAQQQLDSLNGGIISYKNVKEHVPEVEYIGQFYEFDQNNKRNTDPLRCWLFENMNYVDFENDVLGCLNEEQLNEVAETIEDDDDFQRTGLILDDWEDANTDHIHIALWEGIKVSFSIKEANSYLKQLYASYINTDSRQHQRELQPVMVDMMSRIKFFNHMTANRKRECNFEINEDTDVSRIPTQMRWALYFKWANIVVEKVKINIKPLQDELTSASTAYEEARMMVDLSILKKKKVIGMTTSGAARLRKLLMSMEPSIVIVEEAAEVLEQHIVTSLTKHCKHLILIGDHQQLRPSAAHMKLARHFNLEISLFERMITNGIHSRRLGVQHRMRPEIAELISPHIYPELENHPSVENFPRVKGTLDNLFFLTHDFQEEEVDDSASRSNHMEADMTLALANYLMQQGYEPEDITILAAYSGQMFYMRNQRDKYKYLNKVKITVVDNYQGEESKIILLSLVRNNSQNKIGFLGTENRVCVALSRAREGFYIFGNIDILKKNSDLWNKIATTLENKASLGTTLMLRCETHAHQITRISTPKDFEKVPEGGCLLKCNYDLPCGHQCPLICHGYDRSHSKVKCYLQCARTICDLKHVCPDLCWVTCKPCKKLVEKNLPCGHKMHVMCHKEPTDPSVLCKTMVNVTLPHCGHETKKPCYLNIANVKCTVPCEMRVEKCGHQCRRRCHVTDDPDHEKYLCEKPCAKAKKGCTAELVGERGNHQCPKKCHERCDDCIVEVMKKRSNCRHSELVPCNEDVNKKKCMKNCARTLICGHFCKKKCYETCGDCQQKVVKEIPDCKHKLVMMCKDEPIRKLCAKMCERLLPCGHPCTDGCRVDCNPEKCTVLTTRLFSSPCGHKVALPCNVYNKIKREGELKPDMLLRYCMEPCGQILECSHGCPGTCAGCYQGRLHVACSKTCERPMICGHLCKEPCSQVCPPCRMPCEVKCPHSKCNKLCGAPCVPCQEKCTRCCEHGACRRRCGEPCSRVPCDERCPKALRCGHPCRGLCGEPCPNICKICRPDDFPKDFLDDDFEDDDKFIQLQDCPHVMEVQNMDNLMMGDSETIKIRDCPFCRKPIINTYRYKDFVNKMIKTEINPVKERVFGNENIIKTRREALLKEVVQFDEDNGLIFDEITTWRDAYLRLHQIVIKQKKVSLPKLEIQFQYMNILDMIGECYKKYKGAGLNQLRDDLIGLINIISKVLIQNVEKISRQLQQDLRIELKRMNGIIQFAKILKHPSYDSAKSESKVILVENKARNAVLTWKVYKEDIALEALKELQDAIKVSGIVTKAERDLIVKAIGSKAGSWYKCPNGHPYSIDACGGAMQISRCVDCGATIGGENHRLFAGNTHGGDIDGSRAAAWPPGR